MALVPLSYNLRSMIVRRSATVLTVVGIGATVAVMAGVLALQQGFATLYSEGGRDDVMVFLRPGATNEGDSIFARDRARVLIKSVTEIRENAAGLPLASVETYLAVRRRKLDGGETNVPIRGVQPMTFEIAGDSLRITEGRAFRQGQDEVIVGKSLVGRVRNCTLGDVIELNTTPMRVVGIFEHEGPYESEIWADVERMGEALERGTYNRVIALLDPGVDPKAFAARMAEHPEVPSKVQSEREYLTSQTIGLSVALGATAAILGVIMGVAAVFTATNTMLSALASRSHEIGILRALGFGPGAIFLSFLGEATVLGLLGGAAGCLMALPLNLVRTGTTNFQTFTEVAFAFRVTPFVLAVSVAFSLGLGLFGGLWPAVRAALMRPTEALRRH